MIFLGSKYPKNDLFNFGNKVTCVWYTAAVLRCMAALIVEADSSNAVSLADVSGKIFAAGADLLCSTWQDARERTLQFLVLTVLAQLALNVNLHPGLLNIASLESILSTANSSTLRPVKAS